ncbi:hypothetical protein NLJ89_g9463 [Agrocybe chaxingu]|uniref:CBM1 domain-containing protein n=1 Tax=Agrocybe chaxingu TaxID=84603 RepID=A0A9W8JZY2_9AGAR|nr:hypothetical protein NLJ89_g9463 [Agrocybe chaxingu]
MQKLLFILYSAAAVLGVALPQESNPSAPAYSQCAGYGLTDTKRCVPGYTCTKVNDFFSLCLPLPDNISTRSPQPTLPPIIQD